MTVTNLSEMAKNDVKMSITHFWPCPTFSYVIHMGNINTQNTHHKIH